MNRRAGFIHEFVEHIPDHLEDGKLYVSISFATAAHKCFCGCGSEIITPISPRDWELTFDGETVSLEPSIGNWSLPCKSHYWITRNRVVWARRWSQKEIDGARAEDRLTKRAYYGEPAPAPINSPRQKPKERRPPK